MKRFAAAVLLALALPAHAGDWSYGDTRREAIYLTLHALDWAQTRTIARHPERWTERNPILGEHPSVGRVDRYFALTAVGHVGVAHALPPEWRKWFQRSTITLEAVIVGRNRHLGIAVDF